MSRILKLVLSGDAKVAGEIELTDSVTFVVGPNGSGKSHAVRWLIGRTAHVSAFAAESKVSISIADLRDASFSNFLAAIVGTGPSTWTIAHGPSARAIKRNRAGHYAGPPVDAERLARLPNVPQQEWLTLFREAAPSLAGEVDSIEFENLSILRHDATGLTIPSSFVRPFRTKIVTPDRFVQFNNAHTRSSSLRGTIDGRLDKSDIQDLFAILESDPALELEVLARIEALTGVRTAIRKDGAHYSAVFSRVGVTGEWDRSQEADGVIALLLLLPYLFSREHEFIVIDEPEAHLYPGLQDTLRKLLYVAAESTGKQILVTTHSERMVAPPLPNFRRSVHVTIPATTTSRVENLHKAIDGVGDDASLVHEWLQDQAFGENQASVLGALFASEVVVVEGTFDLIFLDRIGRYVGREYRAGAAGIIEANGKGGIARLVRFLRLLGRLVKVVVDADVIDQPGVLGQIAVAMGDDRGAVAGAMNDHAQLRAVAREFDLHILEKSGMEGYYTTLGERPIHPSKKRDALVRELKSIQDLDMPTIRARYGELISILEAVVRRMPGEWLDAHMRDTNRSVADLMYQWHAAARAGRTSGEELAETLRSALEFFDRWEFGVDGSISLHHRYLQPHALVLRFDDNPITVVDTWRRRFEPALPSPI